MGGRQEEAGLIVIGAGRGGHGSHRLGVQLQGVERSREGVGGVAGGALFSE